MLTREAIIDAIQAALEAEPDILALWEAGSAAFDRVDPYSDIDLMVLAADGRERAALATLEAAIGRLAPIQDQFELPPPTWHGHLQKFIRLENTSEFLIIDVVIMAASRSNRFLYAGRHGEARFLFDRANVAASLEPDEAAKGEPEDVHRRLDALSGQMRLLGNFVRKELLRGRPLDALAFYQGLMLRPLIELLRIRHDPRRRDFGGRYLHSDLPPAVVERVQRLSFVSSAADLEEKERSARERFWQLMGALENQYDEQ